MLSKMRVCMLGMPIMYIWMLQIEMVVIRQGEYAECEKGNDEFKFFCHYHYTAPFFSAGDGTGAGGGGEAKAISPLKASPPVNVDICDMRVDFVQSTHNTLARIYSIITYTIHTRTHLNAVHFETMAPLSLSSWKVSCVRAMAHYLYTLCYTGNRM